MTEFEKMVQKWVVKDYFNPSIKAEVIWDMLLSEFITEIITFGLGDEADEIFLLAKEFPISNEKVVNGKETLSSAKIDYLLLRRPESQKPQIILVELKTSNDSFNEEQLVRYRSYLGGKKTEKFWEHYRSIISTYVTPVCYRKTLFELENSRKYVQQISDIKKVVQEIFPECKAIIAKKNNAELINFLKKKYQAANFQLVYLSMTEIKMVKGTTLRQYAAEQKLEDLKNIILKEIMEEDTGQAKFEKLLGSNNEKTESWKVLSKIMNATLKRGSKSFTDLS